MQAQVTDLTEAALGVGKLETPGMTPARALRVSNVDAPASNLHSSALEASHVLSAAPCKVRSVKAINTGVTTAYLMLFDAAALPADGTAPSRCPIPIAAGDVNGDTWEGSTAFATGCVAALSSTVATLTVTGAVGWFDAEVL
jgi:hypothetical protein